VDGHIAAFSGILSVCKELAHEAFQRKASLLEDASFSILGEYDVFWQQCSGRPNRNSLLSSRNLAN
jgi:hypothetical protein